MATFIKLHQSKKEVLINLDLVAMMCARRHGGSGEVIGTAIIFSHIWECLVDETISDIEEKR